MQQNSESNRVNSHDSRLQFAICKLKIDADMQTILFAGIHLMKDTGIWFFKALLRFKNYIKTLPLGLSAHLLGSIHRVCNISIKIT